MLRPLLSNDEDVDNKKVEDGDVVMTDAGPIPPADVSYPTDIDSDQEGLNLPPMSTLVLI